MSRPHDGHSMFPYFTNTFRMVGPKRRSPDRSSKRSPDRSSKRSPDRSSSEINLTLNAFEVTLTERLKQLKPKNPKGFLNISWLHQALEILCLTHKDLKPLIGDLQFPATEWDEKWMDQYLDDTLKLMDICIALNSEISRLQESQLLIQYVLHMLDFSAGNPPSEKLSRAKDSLLELVEQTNLKGISKNGANTIRNGKIENCTSILKGLSNSLQFGKVKLSAKGKVLLRAMHGVKATTIFVCSVVATALSGSLAPLIELQIPDKFMWSTTFMSLQKEVHQEIKANFGDTGILKELEILDAAIQSVYSNIFQETRESEQIKIAIQELRQSVELLTQGTDPLTRKVNDFFQIVLNGRNALLDSLRLTGNEDVFKGDDSAHQ